MTVNRETIQIDISGLPKIDALEKRLNKLSQVSQIVSDNIREIGEELQGLEAAATTRVDRIANAMRQRQKIRAAQADPEFTAGMGKAAEGVKRQLEKRTEQINKVIRAEASEALEILKRTNSLKQSGKQLSDVRGKIQDQDTKLKNEKKKLVTALQDERASVVDSARQRRLESRVRSTQVLSQRRIAEAKRLGFGEGFSQSEKREARSIQARIKEAEAAVKLADREAAALKKTASAAGVNQSQLNQELRTIEATRRQATTEQGRLIQELRELGRRGTGRRDVAKAGEDLRSRLRVLEAQGVSPSRFRAESGGRRTSIEKIIEQASGAANLRNNIEGAKQLLGIAQNRVSALEREVKESAKIESIENRRLQNNEKQSRSAVSLNNQREKALDSENDRTIKLQKQQRKLNELRAGGAKGFGVQRAESLIGRLPGLEQAGNLPEFDRVLKQAGDLLAATKSSLTRQTKSAREISQFQKGITKIEEKVAQGKRITLDEASRLQAFNESQRRQRGFGPGGPGTEGGIPAQLALPAGDPSLPRFRGGARPGLAGMETVLGGLPVPRIVERLGGIRTEGQAKAAFEGVAAENKRAATRASEIVKTERKIGDERAKQIAKIVGGVADSGKKIRSLFEGGFIDETKYNAFRRQLIGIGRAVGSEGVSLERLSSNLLFRQRKIGEIEQTAKRTRTGGAALDPAEAQTRLNKALNSGRALTAQLNILSAAGVDTTEQQNNLQNALNDAKRKDFDLNRQSLGLLEGQLGVVRSFVGAERSIGAEAKDRLKRAKDITRENERQSKSAVALASQREAALNSENNRIIKLQDLQRKYNELLVSGATGPSIQRAQALIERLPSLEQTGNFNKFDRDAKRASSALLDAASALRLQTKAFKENERQSKSAVALASQREAALDSENSRNVKLQGLQRKLNELRASGATGSGIQRAQALIGRLPSLERAGNFAEFDREAKRASNALLDVASASRLQTKASKEVATAESRRVAATRKGEDLGFKLRELAIAGVDPRQLAASVGGKPAQLQKILGKAFSEASFGDPGRAAELLDIAERRITVLKQELGLNRQITAEENKKLDSRKKATQENERQSKSAASLAKQRESALDAEVSRQAKLQSLLRKSAELGAAGATGSAFQRAQGFIAGLPGLEQAGNFNKFNRDAKRAETALLDAASALKLQPGIPKALGPATVLGGGAELLERQRFERLQSGELTQAKSLIAGVRTTGTLLTGLERSGTVSQDTVRDFRASLIEVAKAAKDGTMPLDTLKESLKELQFGVSSLGERSKRLRRGIDIQLEEILGASGVGGPAGGGRKPQEVFRDIGAIPGVNLSRPAQMSSVNLEKVSQALAEFRGGLDLTDAEMRILANTVGRTEARIGRELGRRDPNADLLTRGLGPRTGRAVSEGLIGGAFPLLFGQGPGASLGGLAGGAAGGFAGGMLGFGLSLLGTAVGQAADDLRQATVDTGSALRDLTFDVSGSFGKIKEMSLFASSGQERLIQSLIESGQVASAYGLIQEELNRKLGVSGVQALQEAAAASSRLDRAMAELGKQIEVFVAGPLADMLNAISGVVERRNVENSVIRAFRDASPEAQAIAKSQLAELNRNKDFGKTVQDSIFNQFVFGGSRTEEPAGPASFAGIETKDLQQVAALLLQSGKPVQQTPEQKADEAIRDAQDLLANAQRAAEIFNKGVEVESIFRDFEQKAIAIKREQQDIDRQSADIRKNYEQQIGDIRRGIEERVTQINLENRRKEIEILTKQGEIRELQFRNAAALLQNQLAGDELAQSLASAVDTYLAEQLSAENQLEQKRRQFEFEMQSLQIETEKYKLDIARTVSKLNTDTAKQIEQINLNIVRKNEDARVISFSTQKKTAEIKLDTLRRELDLAKQKNVQDRLTLSSQNQAFGPSPFREAAGKVLRGLADDIDRTEALVNEQAERLSSLKAPSALTGLAPLRTQGVDTKSYDEAIARGRRLQEQLVDLEETVASLNKEASKIQLLGRLDALAFGEFTNEQNRLQESLINLDSAFGSTDLAVAAINASYDKYLARVKASTSLSAQEKNGIIDLVTEYKNKQIALEKLLPTIRFYQESVQDLNQKLEQGKSAVAEFFESGSEFERYSRIIANSNLGGDQQAQAVLKAAKAVDTLNQKTRQLQRLRDLAQGWTDSFIGFNSQLLKTGNLMESLQGWVEDLASRSVDMLLEMTLRPIQEKMFQDLAKFLGFEKPADPILKPLESMDKNIDSIRRELEGKWMGLLAAPKTAAESASAPANNIVPGPRQQQRLAPGSLGIPVTPEGQWPRVGDTVGGPQSSIPRGQFTGIGGLDTSSSNTGLGNSFLGLLGMQGGFEDVAQTIPSVKPLPWQRMQQQAARKLWEWKNKSKGLIPEDIKTETLRRLQQAEQLRQNWRPEKAIWQERENRWRPETQKRSRTVDYARDWSSGLPSQQSVDSIINRLSKVAQDRANMAGGWRSSYEVGGFGEWLTDNERKVLTTTIRNTMAAAYAESVQQKGGNASIDRGLGRLGEAQKSFGSLMVEFLEQENKGGERGGMVYAEKALERLKQTFEYRYSPQRFRSTRGKYQSPTIMAPSGSRNSEDNLNPQEWLQQQREQRQRLNQLNELPGFGPGNRLEGASLFDLNFDTSRLEKSLGLIAQAGDAISPLLVSQARPRSQQVDAPSSVIRLPVNSFKEAVEVAAPKTENLGNAAEETAPKIENLGNTIDGLNEKAAGLAGRVGEISVAEEKRISLFDKFGQVLGAGIQLVGSVAMGVGGVEAIKKGGTYNTLIGISSIFGSIAGVASGVTSLGKTFKLKGFADGGRPPLDRPSWIGERGLELWWPDQAGTVIPMEDLFVPGLNDDDGATAPGMAYGRREGGEASDVTTGASTGPRGAYTRGGYGSAVPYQKSDMSREIERLDQVIGSPGDLPPIKYETQQINSYEFVTPEQLEESNNRTAQNARRQTIRELSDSLRTRTRLRIQ